MKDGTKSYEIMRRFEINKVRQMSQTGADGQTDRQGKPIPPKGPWVDWFAEMAKKTVMRRHAKTLPMSGDVLIDVEGPRARRVTRRLCSPPASERDFAGQAPTDELFNSDEGEHRRAHEEEANRILGEMSGCTNVPQLKRVYDGNQLELAGLPEDLASRRRGRIRSQPEAPRHRSHQGRQGRRPGERQRNGGRKVSAESIRDPKKSADYWARVHIASDRSPAVPLKPTFKRSATVLVGQGVRTSRGGFSEERRP
jgi:hypothetical protein